MVRRLALLLPLLSVLVHPAPAAAQGAATAGPDWVLHRPDGAGFSIRAPAGWQARPPRRPNVRLLIVAPVLREGLNANCNIAAEAMDVTAEEAREANGRVQDEAFWRDLMGRRAEMTVRERRLEQVNGRPAHFLVAERIVENADLRLFMTIANMVILRDGWMLFAACGVAGRTRGEAGEAWTLLGPTIGAILGSVVVEGR